MSRNVSDPREQRAHRLNRLAWIVLAALVTAIGVLPLLLLPGESSPPPPSSQSVAASRPKTNVPAPTPPATSRPTTRLKPAQGPATSAVAGPEPATAAPPSTKPEIPKPKETPRPPLPLPTSRPASSEEWDRSVPTRQKKVEQFGGTHRTEDAVAAGLAWLANHQSPDGTWNRFDFLRLCPPDDRCPGVAVRRDQVELRPGLTGLALLAFLGAGYTDRNEPYADTVGNAVAAIVLLQQPHGGFGVDEGMAGYNDALATLALAEFYALVRDDRLREPLERAVARVVSSQQPLGGWDYLATASSGRNDTSITAWMVQALHACAAVGIAVPPETLIRAALHFARATEPDGRVRYADSGTGFRVDEGFEAVYRYGPGMLAAGLTAEQMLGWRITGDLPRAQRSLLFADPPSAEKARGRDPTRLHNEYYWYYGTLAMFQRGGKDWERWNARLRDAILPLQDRSKRGDQRKHRYGSWAPFGRDWGLWGRMGSRIYTTAICTLTLEIYYRHTPAFLTQDAPYSAADWSAFLRGATKFDRRTAVRVLSQLRYEIGEPPLVELLEDENEDLALAAAVALAELDSPLGAEVLERVIPMRSPFEQQQLGRSLSRCRAVLQLPPAQGRVRLYDAATRLATIELPRSYVGMALTVYRRDAEVAQMRVIQRFTEHAVVVAELIRATTPPQTGDTVTTR